MTTELRITETIVAGKRIEVFFEPSPSLRKFFPERVFWLEHSVSVEGVPESVAIIPFLCGVLPIIWITNARLVVREIDEDFMHAIPRIREGYARMYPRVNFRGSVDAEKLVRNHIHPGEKRALAFFSGGVDGHCTVIDHLDESPHLMTIWGADVPIDNEAGWKTVSRYVNGVADHFGLEPVEVKSNFRTFLNHSHFKRSEKAKWDYDYWHRLQHGIGLIGHAAPYCYVNNLDTVYFASTFSPAAREVPGLACASDPTIDEQVSFFGARVYHDRKELSRQEKVGRIVAFSRESGEKLPLRVCWQSDDGGNCCRCEKCFRTIMAIITAGDDPNNYGLKADAQTLAEIEDRLTHRTPWSLILRLLWAEVQEEYAKGLALPWFEPHTQWLEHLEMKLVKPDKWIHIAYRSGISRVRRLIRRA